jgi:hypothetical protein
MAHFNTSVFGQLAKIDLVREQSYHDFKKSMHMPEFVAHMGGLAFCILGLRPNHILYTSELYSDFCGLELKPGSTLPLSNWLDSLQSCSGVPLGNVVAPFLDELSRFPETSEQDEALLVFDYCRRGTEDRIHHLQVQISILNLKQSNPNVLLLCSVRRLEFLPRRFSHEVRLMYKGEVIRKERVAPPINQHPLLKDLSFTEHKVIARLYTEGSHPKLPQLLNMAHDTLKTHRKHILKKTGFSHTEALLAVLKWDLGEHS